MTTDRRTALWLGLLLAWNLAVTLVWLADSRPARADALSCQSVRRELAEARRDLERKEDQLKSLASRMRRIAQGNIQAVEKALSGTGLSVDGLVRQQGKGGPFVPAEDHLPETVLRWEALSRALAVLPLAAPLTDYVVTSGFGKRNDPLNRRRAMHEGIDLKAPLRTPVQATGPGKVVFAGRRGGYGRLVEVDHGMGVVTRYAHLAAIHVRPGQTIKGGQRVGLLGNSGRSSGPHLHYEVVVDGKPRNPDRFLKAGRHLSRRGW